MNKKDIWVIIPAHNEGKRIGAVLKDAKKYAPNILVVDDGSSDNTSEVARQQGIKTLTHIVNLGKGGAAKTGCDYAIKNGAKAVVLIDADGQHEPSLIPEFFEKVKDYDIVFGYRKLNKNMPSILRFGNKFINSATEFLFNISLHDTQCGFRAIKSKAYIKIRWHANDYSMESEMIANAGKRKLSYTEIPIPTKYTDRYKGTTVLDGVKIVTNMIFWRLTR